MFLLVLILVDLRGLGLNSHGVLNVLNHIFIQIEVQGDLSIFQYLQILVGLLVVSLGVIKFDDRRIKVAQSNRLFANRLNHKITFWARLCNILTISDGFELSSSIACMYFSMRKIF